MEEYKIKADVLQATLAYLQNRPFKEVAQLINVLSQLEKLPEEKPKK